MIFFNRVILLILFLVFAAAINTYAKPTKKNKVILLVITELQDSIKPPLLLRMKKPEYPIEAREKSIEGTVYLKILVNSNGKAEEVKIFKSDNSIFNQPAIDAIKQSEFHPSFSKGKPIKAWMIVPVSFELKSGFEKLFDSINAKIQKKEFKSAIENLNELISMETKKSELYKLRAQCFANLEQYEYARLDYRRAIAFESGIPNKKHMYEKELNKILESWYRLLNKKIDNYQKKIAIDKNDPSNYLEIAKCYKNMESWKNAEEWYNYYLTLNPNPHSDEIIRYTEILAKTGSIIKGEEILRINIERNPKDWRLLSRHGYFSLWLGKDSIAKKSFEAALNIKPFFQEAIDGLEMINKRTFFEAK